MKPRYAISFVSTLILVLSLLALIAAGKTMLLDETDNHTRVVLYVGDAISVKLTSNPTTGFSWSVANLPAVLQQLESKTETGKGGRAGESGFQYFTFKAKAAGESTLKLNYARPFEKNSPPAKTFFVSISIEPRPGPPVP
jgi:inhibitor of cysteine peptidase